ncbi:MAG: S1C family serine protease [Candidatus Dormibacteria bacterium]
MRTVRLLLLGMIVVIAAAGGTTMYLARRPAAQGGVARAQVQGTTGAETAVTAASSAAPSVVRVETGAAPPDGSPGPGGTGVVIDPRGYVLTAEAVVAGASTLAVAVPGGRTLAVTVVGSDPTLGLTLLKVENGALRAVAIASANPLRAGAGVVLLGASPAPEVAVATVSSTNVSVAVADAAHPGQQRLLNGMLGLDLSPRDGEAGAPLVDGQGRLIGVVVAVEANGGQPVAWAVDMADAASSIQQLIQAGHVTDQTLGFDYRQLTPTLAADAGVPGGVVVTQVSPGSAAEQAGLLVGEVVVSAASTVLDEGHPLRRLVRDLPLHQSVALRVRSGEAERTVTVSVIQVEP